jgi:hypothetical protein
MVRTGDVNDVSGHNCTARDPLIAVMGPHDGSHDDSGSEPPRVQSAGPMASFTVAVWLLPDVSVQPTVTVSPG